MTKKILMSASFAVFSGTLFALVAGAPSAEANVMLQQCISGSKNRTVNCCEAAMVNASLLLKDSLSGQNCTSAVRCSIQGGNGRRCYVRLETIGGGDTVRSISRGQRK